LLEIDILSNGGFVTEKKEKKLNKKEITVDPIKSGMLPHEETIRVFQVGYIVGTPWKANE
jgi:hypothetical protein